MTRNDAIRRYRSYEATVHERARRASAADIRANLDPAYLREKAHRYGMRATQIDRATGLARPVRAGMRADRREKLARKRRSALASVPARVWDEVGAAIRDAVAWADAPVEAPTGSTRGVRRNPVTGKIERF